MQPLKESSILKSGLFPVDLDISCEQSGLEEDRKEPISSAMPLVTSFLVLRPELWMFSILKSSDRLAQQTSQVLALSLVTESTRGTHLVKGEK